ncbi:MAG: heme NO-binding domain-containing protein [Pseudohongiella sp.]|nr:heme NO-binding domain-containing protein [Pseudohongiella sp.]
MYGLIHNSLRAMVKTELGNDAWAEIVEAAGLSEKDFLSLKSYDDSVVLALLAATHKTTGRSVNDLLYDFGRHFIKHTAFGHYSAVMSMHGSSVWELLDSLNHMHDRIASSFPDYAPPSFQLLGGDGSYELIYSSTRQGLTSFVRGLIAGLADHFSVVIDIKVLEDVCPDQGQITRFSLKAIEPT